MRKGNNHEFMINRKRLDFARKAANKCMHICAGMAYLLCGWDDGARFHAKNGKEMKIKPSNQPTKCRPFKFNWVSQGSVLT